MHIEVKWFDKQFNLELSTKQGKEPFLIVRGLRIVNGSKGEFISMPSTKKDDGKYWNHAIASDDFQKVVLEKAKANMPNAKPATGGRVDDDIPFNRITQWRAI